MTSEQLRHVLEWKYPDAQIGKAYRVTGDELTFDVWVDRATGQPSVEPKPTMAQCEAWLPNLPASVQEAEDEAIAIQRYDVSKDLKALALVVMDELNMIRGASAATIAAMNDRTDAQLRTAFINKRKTL